MAKLFKNEKLYSNIRIIYVISVIMYSLARQNITALQPFLMSDLLNLAVIGIAGLLVLWDVFVFKNIWKMKYIWLLVAFTGVTVVSSLLGFKYGYVENVKAIANLFIQFFLLYVVGVRKDKQGIEKEAKLVATVISAGWFIAAAISLYMYFADIYYTQNRYLWGDVTEIVQGFVREHMGAVVMRLWGIFVDPNFAASISVVVICLALFVIFTTKCKALKIFQIVNIVVQFFYVVLSNSRMAVLILAFSVCVGAWYYSSLLIKQKKFNRFVKETVSVALAVVCVGISYVTMQATKTTLPYVRYGIQYAITEMEKGPQTSSDVPVSSETASKPPVSSATSSKTPVSSETASKPPVSSETASKPPVSSATASKPPVSSETASKPPVSSATASKPPVSSNVSSKLPPVVENLDRDDIAAKHDKTNGRLGLWMEGINAVFKDNVIFGVGPRNYHTVANEVDSTLKISSGFSIHNSFVELLMGNGIVGTLLLFAFFVLCAKDAIVIKYKNPEASKSIGFLMLSVLILLVCGMFISCLFYTLSGATIILFAFLGYAMRLCQLAKQEAK